MFQGLLTSTELELLSAWLQAGLAYVLLLSAFVMPIVQMVKVLWSKLQQPIGDGKLTLAQLLDQVAALVLSAALVFIFGLNAFPTPSGFPLLLPVWVGMLMTVVFSSLGAGLVHKVIALVDMLRKLPFPDKR